ncbi:VWA domain-containing protein [Flavilitoribacter nigricans]|uniref:VWFA domain-containing protein n=1 Tax=Flavilitoribacter nigricans (strain ATCC 23147 / DSM 23189 / NBRC 102662 / NCIMB 1420 / SS-2) TaxID=1122177 RepID=A0A2D0MZ52_FLAN2|nr:VWA domain-containing protein [Flavilitoribacter nigricans]PHN00733.1 hypothetical protein CRP01_40665 [Flavilitoribacter nigricans DSM 23189 = NBRC 102662]
MKTIHPLMLLAACALFLLQTSCKKESHAPDPINDCWQQSGNQIKFTVLNGPEVNLPSKISIFFKLDDKDGKPVANLTESDFHIFEQGLNDACPLLASQSEAQRRISEREQIFSYATLLVLDLSGSVVEDYLQDLKSSAKRFIRTISDERPDSEARIGIWWFDGGTDLHQLEGITSDTSKLIARINGITKDISTDNSTNLYGAVTQIVPIADAVLTTEKQRDVISGASVVLFTDGRDRANRVSRETALQAVSEADPAINYFTIGLGGEINTEDLRRIGRDGFFPTGNIGQLESTFQAVAQTVNDEANSYYFFEYCSPIRNGANNRLILEAVHNGRRGFLEASFDATGFSGGCGL